MKRVRITNLQRSNIGNYIVHRTVYIYYRRARKLPRNRSARQLCWHYLKVSKTLMNVVMKSGILPSSKRLCPCEICLNQTTPFLQSISTVPLALCRRAFYLRRLRLSNKLFVAKCSRKFRRQSVPPWNFSAVLQLVKTIRIGYSRWMGPESMSRFDISWDSVTCIFQMRAY